MQRRFLIILFLLVSLSLTGCLWVRPDNGLTTINLQGEGASNYELLVTGEKDLYLVELGPEKTVTLPLPRGTWQIQALARDEAGQVVAVSQSFPVRGGRQSIASPLLVTTEKQTTEVRLANVRHAWSLDGRIEVSWDPLTQDLGQLEIWKRERTSPFWQPTEILGVKEVNFSSSDPDARNYFYAIRYVAPPADETFASPLMVSQGSNQGALDVTWSFEHIYPSVPMILMSSLAMLEEPDSDETFTELIAHFHTESAFERRGELLAALGLKPIKEIPSLLAVVVESLEHSERSLEEWSYYQDEFLYLEPNWIVRAASLGSAAQMPWYLDYIRLAGAHRITQGNHSVRIAVLDSGLNSETLPPSVQVLPGYNFVGNNYNTRDDFEVGETFHGTKVSRAIAEVIPLVSIQPVKVLGSTGSGSADHLSEGLLFAAGLHPSIPNPYPAQIINMSLGVNTQIAPSSITKAIERIRRETDILLIAASGNTPTGISTPGLFYPAALREVVAVGAIERTNPPRRAAYSHFGEGLDLVAPPSFEAGTSFATALVSGVSGLMLSQGISAQQLREILNISAMDIGEPGWDLEHGHGLLNAQWAVLGITEAVLVITDSEGASMQQNVPLKGTKKRFFLPPGEYHLEAWVNLTGGMTPQVGDYTSRSGQISVLEDGESSAHLTLREKAK